MYRQKQEESVENVIRCWKLFQSLPAHLKAGIEVLKPEKAHLPNGGEIVLKFKDGTTSRIIAMSSSQASGHGKTAALVVMDEFSRMDNASEIMKAVQPAAGAKGKILIISTANGTADEETGEGNQFAYLYRQAEEKGFAPKFLAWSLHPDRDQKWYDTDPEIVGLRSHERAEQYPADEDEAFTLTNRVFFDPDDLSFYNLERKIAPLKRCKWELEDRRHARLVEHASGNIWIYKEPDPDHKYAIGADVASGHGRDYSCAFVIDLATMDLVAEFHGKVGEDVYARDLHFLGAMYNRALIAIETQGGYGTAVVISMRDGVGGRPPYRHLYRHILGSRPDLPEAKPFGWPTNVQTRPTIVNQLEKAVRERVLPGIPQMLLREMQTFVEHETGTSPRAQEGTRDDRVMACCIALEMYRQRGSHPNKPKRKASRAAVPAFT